MKYYLGFLGVLIAIFIFIMIITPSTQAESGCCSHHGGVNYCNKEIGKYICKDGTESKSCNCAKQSEKQHKNNENDSGATFSVVVAAFITIFFGIIAPLSKKNKHTHGNRHEDIS